MTDDRSNCIPETPLPKDAGPPRSASSSTLDMDEVGEIDIAFERPLSHPRFATFD